MAWSSVKRWIEERPFYRAHKQAIDQTGHVLMYAVLAYAGTPLLAIAWERVRELAPKPWGQWPPGNERRVMTSTRGNERVFTPMYLKKNVEDLRLDLVFGAVGAIVGGVACYVIPWWGLL